MNQKQRDYLIKRLDEIRRQKIANLELTPIDKQPYLDKIKIANTNKIIDLVTGKIESTVKDLLNRNYFYEGIGFCIDIVDITLNAKEVYESYDKARDKAYSVITQKKQSVDKKYNELCDKLIFADDYEEASKLIAEFTKF